MIRAILHADKHWGIGKNNSLMFSIPRDMKFFRETTSGKTVVMGGNTLRSFPGGKPLARRWRGVGALRRYGMISGHLPYMKASHLIMPL